MNTWVAAKDGLKKARWGFRAPKGSNLEVKGAFIDVAGKEVVPSDKIGRRFEIARYGFS